MKENKTQILRCLVGSHAHGLANAESDLDFRGVYVIPTQEILSLGFNYKGSHWVEGEKEDQTAWEIGHFLHLAMKCNPTILECFKAPIYGVGGLGEVKINSTDSVYFGDKLQKLFPYVWNPQDAYNAFVGYGLNQRKKFLDDKDGRWRKYAVAYLRTLHNLYWLLRQEDFTLQVNDLDFKQILLDIKDGKVKDTQKGGIIDLANDLTHKAKEILPLCKHESDLTKVNEFLLRIRKEFWE